MYAFKKNKILYVYTPMKSAVHTYCVLPLFPSMILLQYYSIDFDNANESVATDMLGNHIIHKASTV